MYACDFLEQRVTQQEMDALDDPTDLTFLTTDAAQIHNLAKAQREAVDKAMSKQQKPAKLPPAPKPPPAPKAPPKPSKAEMDRMIEEDEYEDRQVALDKVMKYRQRFPELKSRNRNLSIKSSLMELLDEVHFIEEQMGTRDDAGLMRPANMVFIAGMYGLEHGAQVWNPLNLKLQGLGQTVQASLAEFEPLIDEFCIKHGMELAASVEVRILGMVAMTVATVHAANTGANLDILSKLGVPQAKNVAVDKDL